MRKSPLFYTVILLALLVGGIYSCKKINGIDNNSVVETPFSLYFTDTAGTLYNSVDGKTITKILFHSDGKPSRSLVVFKGNIMWAKNALYISDNAGTNFNHSFDSLRPFRFLPCVGDTLDLNQSMLYPLPEMGRLYAMDSTPLGVIGNYFGLAFNDSLGYIGHWKRDGTYDTVGDMGILPVKAFSMTQTTNGVVSFLAYHSDGYHVRNMWGVYDAGYVRWHENTGNPSGIGGIGGLNQGGTPLPSSAADIGHYYLGHLNNQLIAIDGTCKYGPYYSNDTGRNWIAYPGMPANTPELCIGSPFELNCLVGTYKKGLYILNLHTGRFEPNNNGLASDLIVRGIAAKEATYKNGNVQKYVFITTNKGIYMSKDGGINWTLTIGGNYVTIY